MNMSCPNLEPRTSNFPPCDILPRTGCVVRTVCIMYGGVRGYIVKHYLPIRRLRPLSAALFLLTLMTGIAPAPVHAATSDPFNIKPVMTAAPTADQTDPVMAGTVISWA